MKAQEEQKRESEWLRKHKLSKREKLRPRGGHESEVKAQEGHMGEVRRCEFSA